MAWVAYSPVGQNLIAGEEDGKVGFSEWGRTRDRGVSFFFRQQSNWNKKACITSLTARTSVLKVTQTMPLFTFFKCFQLFILLRSLLFAQISVIFISPFFQVKVWDTSSGFSYVTFDQHTGGVTDLTFIESGKAIVSCSQDGTVRAFDLNRWACILSARWIGRYTNYLMIYSFSFLFDVYHMFLFLSYSSKHGLLL